MQDKIRRIKGEIRLRMIDARNYYRNTLESLDGDTEDAETVIFRGWLEGKLKDAERAIIELTPKTLLTPNLAAIDPPRSTIPSDGGATQA